MDKIILKFPKKSEVEVFFLGGKVLVNPIIGIEEQKVLRAVYLNSFFKDGKQEEWDEPFASFMFRREVLKQKTNIDIDSIKDLEEIDSLIWGEFYDKVSSAIVNYEEVKKIIELSSVNEIKRIEMRSGLGYVLGDLLEKLKPIMDEISKITPEDFAEIKNSISKFSEREIEVPKKKPGNKKVKSEYVQ